MSALSSAQDKMGFVPLLKLLEKQTLSMPKIGA
jgi:hypothetical protein